MSRHGGRRRSRPRRPGAAPLRTGAFHQDSTRTHARRHAAMSGRTPLIQRLRSARCRHTVTPKAGQNLAAGQERRQALAAGQDCRRRSWVLGVPASCQQGGVILSPLLQQDEGTAADRASVCSTEAWVCDVWTPLGAPSGRGSRRASQVAWTGRARNCAALARAKLWLQRQRRRQEAHQLS